jgi:hypothetical protein
MYALYFTKVRLFYLGVVFFFFWLIVKWHLIYGGFNLRADLLVLHIDDLLVQIVCLICFQFSFVFHSRMRCDLVRFQSLTAASMKMSVLWNVAPCDLIEVHRRFRGAWLPVIRPTRRHDDGGRRLSWNLSKLLLDYTEQQPEDSRIQRRSS